MMRVLVTGGAGFIGSHLVDSLIAEGHEVHVIDNLSVGHLSNIQHHRDNPRFHFHERDITDLESIRPLFKDIERVFHLAARADIVPSIENPILYHRTNVEGTVNVLEASRANGVKRFIYAASSSCYGIPDQFPTPETAEIRPQYPYALSKYLGECAVLHWGMVYKFPVLSLRFFNVYGPRVRTSGTYGAVFGVFLAQKANGRPFTVVGDGSQTRDFTYVTDVARAIGAAANSDRSGEIYNVGSGGTYSVHQLVQLLGGPIEFIPKRPGEPDCTFADTTRIRERLGWQPQVSFEVGVEKMLGELQNWASAPLWNSESIGAATAAWFKYLQNPRPQNG